MGEDVVAGKAGVTDAHVARQMAHILQGEVLEGVGADALTDLLLGPIVGCQLFRVGDGGAVVTGEEEGRGGDLHMDLFGPGLPEELDNPCAGAAPDNGVVHHDDPLSAFNGIKKGTIVGKGVINNRMSNHMMRKLEAEGIPTHLIEELSERETAVKKVTIVPLEVIVRNISAGSFAKRYGVEEGIVFDEPTIEFSYKNDDLGDPLINAYHAAALKLATWAEIDQIKDYRRAPRLT